MDINNEQSIYTCRFTQAHPQNCHELRPKLYWFFYKDKALCLAHSATISQGSSWTGTNGSGLNFPDSMAPFTNSKYGERSA